MTTKSLDTFGHLKSHLNMSGCSLEKQWHRIYVYNNLHISHFIFTNKTKWPQADFDKNIGQESVQILQKKG